MAWVYILRGASGRHYIGSTVDLHARFAQHLRGHTATSKRLGGELKIVAKKEFPTLQERDEPSAFSRRKRMPRSQHFILAKHEQPRKLSGLVGSSIIPLADFSMAWV